MGPGTINVMKPGEDITFGDPKRPASGFVNFERALCEQIGAALEVPADLLLKSFNNTYSSSRAALLEAWKAFHMRRMWFANDFCDPIYEMFVAEAVARGSSLQQKHKIKHTKHGKRKNCNGDQSPTEQNHW